MIVASRVFNVDAMNSKRQEEGKLVYVVQIVCRMEGCVPFPQHVMILLLVEFVSTTNASLVFGNCV